MALNPEDPCSGFRHSKVLKFINKQMAKHVKGPEFYLKNQSLSWEEVEDNLKVILEDSKMPNEAQEACAWGGLALGMRFACNQGHLQGHRVQWLHDFSRLQKATALALASDLKHLTQKQEMERKEVAFQLHMAQARLAELQRERDLLRVKILQAELRGLPVAVRPSGTFPSATVRGAGTGTPGVGPKEDLSPGATGGKEKQEEEADKAASSLTGAAAALEEATEEPTGSFMQSHGVMKWKNFPLKRQRAGDLRSKETFVYSLSQSLNLRSTVSSEPITVELPASFTYSYESPFPAIPTISQAPAMDRPPQMPSYTMASDMTQLSDMEIHRGDHQELHKDKRASAFRRPGDWDCPWCKAVNFSRRENCFHCGKGIWLQNP